MNPQINQPISTQTNPQSLPPQNDPTESDPTVFLAKQILEIKTTLEKEISDLKTQVASLMEGESKYQKEMDDFKKLLKESLNG